MISALPGPGLERDSALIGIASAVRKMSWAVALFSAVGLASLLYEIVKKVRHGYFRDRSEGWPGVLLQALVISQSVFTVGVLLGLVLLAHISRSALKHQIKLGFLKFGRSPVVRFMNSYNKLRKRKSPTWSELAEDVGTPINAAASLIFWLYAVAITILIVVIAFVSLPPFTYFHGFGGYFISFYLAVLISGMVQLQILA